jgi:Presenilin
MEEQYDSLSNAIARVVFPVTLCMALAVYLVHSVDNNGSNVCGSTAAAAARVGKIVSAQPGTTTSNAVDSSNIYDGKGGIIFIGIFVTCMVVFTFVLLLLYKHGCNKVIFAWLLFAVSLIFAYVGGVYIFEFCSSRCIDIDWISLVFIVWNFTITGILAIFGTVPRLVNQAYLIVMSALMAYIFRRLPEWATWAILMILVFWDLFAVLTPCGPLKMLVEIARERDDPLPALVYDTNPNAVGRDDEAQPAVVFPTREEKAKMKADRLARKEAVANAKAAAAAESAAAVRTNRNRKDTVFDPSNTAAPGTTDDSGKRGIVKRLRAGGPSSKSPEPIVHAQEQQPEAQPHQSIGTLGHHLKLGLG